MARNTQPAELPEEPSSITTEGDGKSQKVELTVVDGAKSTTGEGIRSVRFGQLSSESIAGEQGSLDLLMDIALELSVELGRSMVPVRDVLRFAQGSLIQLNKLAGEPVDVLVNGKLIARGEVVVVDDSFGVRLTEIVSESERLA